MVTQRARALCLWALCLGGLMATVQTGHCEVSATLTGIVVDGRGRPVAGAHVTLVGDGARTTHVLTGPDGVYRFPALQPGLTYSVTVGHAGYRSVEYEGMRLETGTTRTLDVRLKVPGEREIVALLSRDPFPYRNLLDAVLRHLDIPARVYDLDQDPEPEETVRRVRAGRPDLILGAGLRAARLIRREIREIP